MTTKTTGSPHTCALFSPLVPFCHTFPKSEGSWQGLFSNCSAPWLSPGHASYIPTSPHCSRMASDWDQLSWRCLYATPPIPTCPNRSWGAHSSAQLLYESRGSFVKQPLLGWILPSLHSICRKAWVVDMTGVSKEILLLFILEGPDRDRGTILARGSRSPCHVYRVSYKQVSAQWEGVKVQITAEPMKCF